jgi:hypothetical protein
MSSAGAPAIDLGRLPPRKDWKRGQDKGTPKLQDMASETVSEKKQNKEMISEEVRNMTI